MAFLSLAFIFTTVVPLVNAQIVVERHRSVASRIIAGVIVGVLFLLALVAFFVARRRRNRTFANIALTRPPPPQGYWTSPPPEQWTPYNTFAHSQPQQFTPNQAGYAGYDTGTYPPAINTNPAYGKEGGYFGNAAAGGYAPPPGPPPNHPYPMGSYQAPPGPPPQAHVTG